MILALSMAALVVTAGGISYAAQTSKSTAPKAPAAKTTAPKAMSATGKIVSYDDASKTLTISTGKGEEHFVLGTSARLQEGAKTITTSTLSGLTGHQAKVHYTMNGSDKTAESVMVSGGAAKSSAKK
jgi:phage baseplate assembly protein gpV